MKCELKWQEGDEDQQATTVFIKSPSTLKYNESHSHPGREPRCGAKGPAQCGEIIGDIAVMHLPISCVSVLLLISLPL